MTITSFSYTSVIKSTQKTSLIIDLQFQQYNATLISKIIAYRHTDTDNYRLALSTKSLDPLISIILSMTI